MKGGIGLMPSAKSKALYRGHGFQFSTASSSNLWIFQPNCFELPKMHRQPDDTLSWHVVRVLGREACAKALESITALATKNTQRQFEPILTIGDDDDDDEFSF
jgi:hypothetical protein